MKQNPGIQTLNANLKDQSQVSVNQQEPRIQKRQIQSCQGLGITEFPSKLKKLEKPHEKDIIQLYSLNEKMNTNLNSESRKLESQASFARQKRKKSQIRKVQLQIEALASKFVLIEKTKQQIYRKLTKKLNYKLKKLTSDRQDGNQTENTNTIKSLLKVLDQTLLLLLKNWTSMEVMSEVKKSA